MLYVNSNNKRETYTAYQAFTMPSSVNGGVIVPLRLPQFTKNELSDIYKLGFCGSVAYILNKFFSKRILSDDISMIIDAQMPGSELLDRKSLLVHFEGRLKKLEDRILKYILGDACIPVLWASCAVRISLLFGIFRELLYCGIRSLDFAVSSDDPRSFIPVFYGKLMGLPVNKIIIAASYENGIWNYLHKGQIGSGEVCKYFIYGLNSAGKNIASEDFFCAVVSNARAEDSIAKLQSTYKKSVDLAAAFSYGALQDYRAITGDNRTTIILNY